MIARRDIVHIADPSERFKVPWDKKVVYGQNTRHVQCTQHWE
jgi:hypothetical protein